MSDQIYYEVHAHLSPYPGNYERELTAWVFGASEEFGAEVPDRLHAEDMLWAYNPEAGWGSLTQVTHDEYGLVWEVLGDFGDSVVWRLEEEPTQEEWDSLLSAIETYQIPPKSWDPNPEQIKLHRLAIVRVVTTRDVVKSKGKLPNKT